MLPLPIVARELRVGPRRAGVYRLRLVVGALTFGLAALFVWRQDVLAPPASASGRALFVSLTLSLAMGALAPVYLTFDCLSSEKREGTLGLLFLTDLRPHDIVLGKLIAAALPSFYGLMAAFPLLAATILTGGVTGTQLWQTSLGLLNLFFFAQSAAIFASALCRRPSASAAIAVGIIVVFGFGLAGMDVMTRHRFWLVGAFSPTCALGLAADIGGIPHRTGAFGLALVDCQLAAWLFLGGAVLALPRTWREKSARGASPKARRLRAGFLPYLESDPFYWLAARRMGDARTGWVLLGLAAAVCPCVMGFFPRWMPWSMVAALALLHGGVKFWAATAAGGSMEEHRRTGSLEMLMACAPLPASDILNGQAKAFWRLFLKPMIFLLCLDFLVAVFTSSDELRAWAVGSLISLPMDLATIAWLAPWHAMSQKKPGRSAVTAFFWVCAFPVLFLLLPFAPAYGGDASYIPEFAVWIFFCVFVDGMLFSGARDNLPAYFRRMAAAAHGGESRRFSLFGDPREAREAAPLVARAAS